MIYDKFEIGDIVTSYNDGYHRVTSIEERPNTDPLIHYTKVYNKNGTPAKKLKNKCHIAYVKHAKHGILNSISECKQTIVNLDAIIKSHPELNK